MRTHYRGYKSGDKLVSRKALAMSGKRAAQIQRTFSCPACPRSFDTEGEYKAHWKERHTDARSRKIAAINAGISRRYW